MPYKYVSRCTLIPWASGGIILVSLNPFRFILTQMGFWSASSLSGLETRSTQPPASLLKPADADAASIFIVAKLNT